MPADATTPIAGPSPSVKGKGPANNKAGGSKNGARKAILKDTTSPANSDEEGDTKANDGGQGPSNKGGATRGSGGKDDDEEEEENMDHEELGKYNTVDPDKMR